MRYAARFVLLSTALPLVCLCIVIGVCVWLRSWEWTVVLLLLTAAAFAWHTSLRRFLRTGGAAGEAPRTEEEVVRACEEGWSGGGAKKVVVVGGAWSFYLQRRGAADEGPAVVVYTHRMTGRLPNGRWAAGTTIREVQAELAREGKRWARARPSSPPR